MTSKAGVPVQAPAEDVEGRSEIETESGPSGTGAPRGTELPLQGAGADLQCLNHLPLRPGCELVLTAQLSMATLLEGDDMACLRGLL